MRKPTNFALRGRNDRSVDVKAPCSFKFHCVWAFSLCLVGGGPIPLANKLYFPSGSSEFHGHIWLDQNAWLTNWFCDPTAILIAGFINGPHHSTSFHEAEVGKTAENCLDLWSIRLSIDWCLGILNLQTAPSPAPWFCHDLEVSGRLNSPY